MSANNSDGGGVGDSPRSSPSPLEEHKQYTPSGNLHRALKLAVNFLDVKSCVALFLTTKHDNDYFRGASEDSEIFKVASGRGGWLLRNAGEVAATRFARDLLRLECAARELCVRTFKGANIPSLLKEFGSQATTTLTLVESQLRYGQRVDEKMIVHRFPRIERVCFWPLFACFGHLCQLLSGLRELRALDCVFNGYHGRMNEALEEGKGGAQPLAPKLQRLALRSIRQSLPANFTAWVRANAPALKMLVLEDTRWESGEAVIAFVRGIIRALPRLDVLYIGLEFGVPRIVQEWLMEDRADPEMARVAVVVIHTCHHLDVLCTDMLDPLGVDWESEYSRHVHYRLPQKVHELGYPEMAAFLAFLGQDTAFPRVWFPSPSFDDVA
jgi:hypothetical protein